MPLGPSSSFSHLSRSEVELGVGGRLAQHQWECSNLLLPGRTWPQVCAQLPGFPQEKERFGPMFWIMLSGQVL